MMKVGFLPLYIELYDKVRSDVRSTMQENADKTAQKIRELDVEVVQAPICRVKSEFAAAVELFKKENAECIITLHLAYSPSLESADVLAESSLDIVMLDITPDKAFSFGDLDKLMYNHGIHGVQDLANLLLRKKKLFQVIAGHIDQPSVWHNLRVTLSGIHASTAMRKIRVGSVGGEFAGMGDFRFDLKDLPMEIVPYAKQEVSDAEVQQEMALDQERFIHGEYDKDLYKQTVKDSLRIRKWVEKEKLDAFTICFPGINRPEWNTVPFLEASKAMARGIGYAGEGDCLTAAFCASVMKIAPRTTFSEMFCPDWENNRIFLSHMGEVNLSLAAQKALLHEVPYKFSDTDNLIKATCCLQQGRAVLADLAPGPDGKFSLICTLVNMVEQDTPSGKSITGWFTPETVADIRTFLEQYSMLGGTHHLLISYDVNPCALKVFAYFMQWDFHWIDDGSME